jgi:ParB family chromosome partitioning protein
MEMSMSSTNKVLKRGLDSLFGGSTLDAETKNDTATLPLASLIPNPNQPRRYFDSESLQELADSIKVQGIIQPLLVRPQKDGNFWEIVAGERRWRAAKMAGLEQAPVLIRELSDNEVMAAALIENLQREDLNPMEEAQALHDLRTALELTQEELAARLGKSRPAVANALRLLQLEPAAQQDLRNGDISAGHARCLLGIDEPEAADLLRARIKKRQMTVRQTEEAAAAWKNTRRFPWDEDTDVQPVATPRAKRKKTPELKKLQDDLSQSLACNVSITGDENSGRISLAYSSSAQFNAILELLRT